jgi:hypothetical protein
MLVCKSPMPVTGNRFPSGKIPLPDLNLYHYNLLRQSSNFRSFSNLYQRLFQSAAVVRGSRRMLGVPSFPPTEIFVINVRALFWTIRRDSWHGNSIFVTIDGVAKGWRRACRRLLVHCVIWNFPTCEID